jgi:hypothetical protein
MEKRTLAGLGGRVAARRALMLLDVHGAATCKNHQLAPDPVVHLSYAVAL